MTKLDEALGLFPSVIKGGEQWSPICQRVLEEAKAELAALRATQPAAPARTPEWLAGQKRIHDRERPDPVVKEMHKGGEP